MGKRDIKQAYWDIELAKEAPIEYIKSIIKVIYPNAIEIENLRNKRISGTDWIIHLPDKTIKLDDKTDTWLGYTGNISLDQKTTIQKDIIQLFVNPDFPGKYLLIDNSKLDAGTLLFKKIKIHQMKTNEHLTRTIIIPIKHIKKAIIKSIPSIEWFIKPRKRTREEGHPK